MALQGGGAHGAFTWGVLDRLLEEEAIVAEAMCGTSAGAINAVVCAYGLHVGGPAKAKELLEKAWQKIALTGSFFLKPGLFDKANSNGGIYNSPGYMFFNAVSQVLSPFQLPFMAEKSTMAGKSNTRNSGSAASVSRMATSAASCVA